MRRTIVVAAVLAAGLFGGAAPATAEPGDPSPSGDPLQQQIEPGQEVAKDEAELGAGHVDLGPRYADGQWTLMVHDATRVEGSVWRHLENTVVRVADAAVQSVPDDRAYDFLGVAPGTGVHVIPQTQNLEVVWLGWNTQDPEVMATVDRGVTLSLDRVDGPGHLVVYLQDGGFGEPDVLWDSRQDADQPFWVDVNTHTHANWVFTEPGVYLVSVIASATLVDGTEEAVTGTLRLAVGDQTDAGEALAAKPSVAASSDGSNGAGEQSAVSPATTEDEDGSSLVLPLAIGAALLVFALGVALWRGRRTRGRALAGENT